MRYTGAKPVLPYVQAAIQEGKRRVDAWFPQANIYYLAPEVILPYDPDQRAFLNINTLGAKSCGSIGSPRNSSLF